MIIDAHRKSLFSAMRNDKKSREAQKVSFELRISGPEVTYQRMSIVRRAYSCIRNRLRP